MKERLLYLDALRGFAILLVITGHLIQYNYTSSINNSLFNIIYSFHMPLFFFLSGCTDAIRDNAGKTISCFKSLINFIFKKFLTLIIPSITWTVIISNCFSTINLNLNRISGFWFLNTLFVIYCIWGVFSYIKHITQKSWIPITVLISGISVLLILGMKRIPLMYLSIFIIGFYYHKIRHSMPYPDIINSILLITFFLTVGYFKYGQTSAGDANRFLMEFPLSIMASIVLYNSFLHFSINKGHLFHILSEIGKYSLGIYLCQFHFYSIPWIQDMECSFSLIGQFCILMFIAMLIAGCCIIIERFIESFPFVNAIMYGKWSEMYYK